MQKVEFGQEIRKTTDLDGRRIDLIGYTHGKECRACRHFFSEQYAKVYHRCKLYPKKHWGAKTIACIYFEERKEVNGSEVKKRTKSVEKSALHKK